MKNLNRLFSVLIDKIEETTIDDVLDFATFMIVTSPVWGLGLLIFMTFMSIVFMDVK